jgi:hypothetical protein
MCYAVGYITKLIRHFDEKLSLMNALLNNSYLVMCRICLENEEVRQIIPFIRVLSLLLQSVLMKLIGHILTNQDEPADEMIISHRHFLPSLVTQRTKIVLESQSFFKT